MNTTQIYLEKRNKVIVSTSNKTPLKKNIRLVASLCKNYEALGYVFSPELFRALTGLSEANLSAFYKETLPVLKKMRGAHKRYEPMYPNFPQQVIDASEAELYWNALLHYWSFYLLDQGFVNETWLPTYEKEERMPLDEFTKLDVIHLGTQEDFENIFTSLISSKSSISESDKLIISSFVYEYKDDIVRLLPEKIHMKEQLAYLAGLLLGYTSVSDVLSKYIKTPTDVLRVAVALSGGDVSLATNTKFVNFSRPQRKFLLGMLESCNTNIVEEMKNYSQQWVRLGEKLHPGEHRNKYTRAHQAFSDLREKRKISTFRGRVEEYIKNGKVDTASKLLADRPGEFARRLDHLLRLAGNKVTQKIIINRFSKVAESVSNSILLQLRTHFGERKNGNTRAVFPKGSLAKAKLIGEAPSGIDVEVCSYLVKKLDDVLIKKYSVLAPLGNVYVDPKLKSYLIPFSQRSASKALKTIVRGSSIPLDGDYDTIRFFIWWKNLQTGPNQFYGRVDIDLSGVILDNNYRYMNDISYYNLKNYAGHHSGDITNAPDGACEFIDISLDKVVKNGGRYIVMSVFSFSSQPFCDLPECFAGWMGRQSPNSGEIFEAKTVKNKVDIASNMKVSLPLIIDAMTREVIWVDLGLNDRPTWGGRNAHSNRLGISEICQVMCQLKKPNLYDLFWFHAKARGKVVVDKKKADVVFSSETDPYETDKILSEYL